MKLTPEKLAEAQRLQAQGWGFDKMACHLVVSRWALMCEMVPGYRERRAEQVRSYRSPLWNGKERANTTKRHKRATARTNGNPRSIGPTSRSESDRYIPPAVIEDRDLRQTLAPRDLTAILCGDPLPGRSALDRRT